MPTSKNTLFSQNCEKHFHKIIISSILSEKISFKTNPFHEVLNRHRVSQLFLGSLGDLKENIFFIFFCSFVLFFFLIFHFSSYSSGLKAKAKGNRA